MMSIETARELAFNHGVSPARCKRCRTTKESGLSWQYGYDDGTDPDYCGYQCQRCGNVQGLTRGHIMRVIRERAAADAWDERTAR